ncbi:MAG: mRNA interferase MazF [Patescibacteria group bacterium]|nr:mRNA interferase MazF [Patescibacteria group bacterium]MDQ5953979.1 mRNA interferase MazF [Patescibacteria group bacterium]MDQ5958883.1 mRNA interferase MazF [Patescibacteria group bacterium]
MKQFDIVWVNLDPTVGKEIKKTRPCVVVSPDELNDSLDTLIVVPLTSTIKNWPFRTNIVVNKKTSSMAFDQLRTISKNRVGKSIGRLSVIDQQKSLNILQTMFAD